MQCLGRRYIPPLAFSAIEGPFGLPGEVRPAWPRIRGWDRQLVCGPTTRKVFRSCNSTWQRCRSTEKNQDFLSKINFGKSDFGIVNLVGKCDFEIVN